MRTRCRRIHSPLHVDETVLAPRACRVHAACTPHARRTPPGAVAGPRHATTLREQCACRASRAVAWPCSAHRGRHAGGQAAALPGIERDAGEMQCIALRLKFTRDCSLRMLTVGPLGFQPGVHGAAGAARERQLARQLHRRPVSVGRPHVSGPALGRPLSRLGLRCRRAAVATRRAEQRQRRRRRRRRRR